MHNYKHNIPFKYRKIERNLKKWDFKLFVKKILMLFSQMEETPFQYQSTV